MKGHNATNPKMIQSKQNRRKYQQLYVNKSYNLDKFLQRKSCQTDSRELKQLNRTKSLNY